MEEHDFWDLAYTHEETTVAIVGTKLTPFREVLLIVKKYMEAKKCQMSINAKD